MSEARVGDVVLDVLVDSGEGASWLDWRELTVAWFPPMGADEVAYHQATVLGRE